MKRYIKSTENYPEYRMDFPVSVIYHSESDTDDAVQIKLSYKTALLFIDGNNVGSLYPDPTDSLDIWVKELKECCEDYGHPISDEKALELATYMIDNIKG